MALPHIFRKLFQFFCFSVSPVWRQVSHLFPQLSEPQPGAVGSAEREVPILKSLRAPLPEPSLGSGMEQTAGPASHHTNLKTSQGKYFLAAFFQGIWITVSSPATDLHLSNDYELQQTCDLYKALSQQILHWMLHGNLFWRSLISPKLLPRRLQSTTILAQLTEEKHNWCRD